MILKTELIKSVLLNTAIGVRELARELGVDASLISRLRNDEVKFKNLTLDTLEKIQSWIDEGNFRVSYDYSELIQEIQEDIEEGLIDKWLYIERGPYNELLDAYPIVDYYYNPDDIEDGVVCERVSTLAVLAEMETFNQL